MRPEEWMEIQEYAIELFRERIAAVGEPADEG